MAVPATPATPAPAPAPASVSPAAELRALHAGLVRLAVFAPLLLVVLLTWCDLVAPKATGSAWGMTLLASGAGAVLLGAGRIRTRRLRNLALAALVPLLVGGALLAAGIPLRMLEPAHWDEFVRGIADGIDAMAGITVPYRGEDAWVRRTLVLGGMLLAAIAALQAFWPRERVEVPGSAFGAAFTIATIYAVPVIERTLERPFLSGAVVAILLTAFLFADRIRLSGAASAAVLLALATLAGAAAAPALDREEPWFDYQQFGRELADRGTVAYSWDHRYGPLDWPRDGQEMARITAQASSYWKTEVLDTFDGRVWRAAGAVAPFEGEGDRDTGSEQWFQTIEVEIRGLRTERFVTAGSAERIFESPRRAVVQAGGTFETRGGRLRKGATYKAEVYTPRPSPNQLEDAGERYDGRAAPWLRVTLPDTSAPVPSRAAGAAAELAFPPFGSGEQVVAGLPGTGIELEGAEATSLIERSSLARIWRLAQRLRAGADSPYAYVRAVRDRVQRGATYSETPGTFENPLDAFLFEERLGYCQHFSGAMALLLRMGGVPARVAVGFSPGRFDREDKEFVVTDYDAHSWVEAYFPRYGWVTFDPTPAAAPPREQLADEQAALAIQRGPAPEGGDRASDPTAGGPAAASAAGDDRSPWALLAALAALAAAGAVLVRRRRRRTAREAASADAELRELERALERTGRRFPPGATLAEVEARLGASGEAAGYLRALSERRFGLGGPAPTGAQRRALRRLLAAGLGRLGRLRAWWALPPRPGA